MWDKGYNSREDGPSSGHKRKNGFDERDPHTNSYRRTDHVEPHKNGHRRSPSCSHRSSSSIDDEVGHYNGVEGSIIKNRYRIIKELGKGTFGSVYKCFDSKHNDHVALKIIRSIKRYIDSAKIEADILDDIYDKQHQRGVNLCVKMYSHFRFEDHYCMVFETLGVSLYDLVKKNDYKRLPLRCVRDVARQLLLALDFLESINMIHTDLKLENVLFTHNTLLQETVEQSGKVHTVYVPQNTNIKLIDFGGATYDDDSSKSRIVNTRQYRSPEVTLELGWSFPSDVWSVGCIVAEVYSGDLLFDTHDELEHLAMIEKCVEDFPRTMVDQSQHGYTYFDRHRLVRLNELNEDSRRAVDRILPLKRYFTLAPEDARSGIDDLVFAMLRIDPYERVKARQALELSFVQSKSAPVSGTKRAADAYVSDTTSSYPQSISTEES